MLAPIVLPTERARRKTKRKIMWMFTWRSTAVRLMGAALHEEYQHPGENRLDQETQAPKGWMEPARTTHVAFCISFVSWPVNTTIPYTHGVFLNCAPLNNI